jgi:hypothetical protein
MDQNLVSYVKGRYTIVGVWNQGDEEIIWK